jgi:hypothetical protein
VRYWDASALVPLLVSEAHTESVRAILAEDARIARASSSSVSMSGSPTQPSARASPS